MAKRNAFLAKQEIRTKLLCDMQRKFTIQQCADMAMIALNEAFGFGPDRLHQFLEEYQAVFDEYADMAISDGKDDPDIEYTRAKVDQKLKQICGDYFVPWEVRYG